jgi:glycerophosphoryl diester phosphodiesterase
MKNLVLIFIMMAFFAPLFSQSQLPAYGICAHRGAMDTHPENTISAFEEAIRLSVQMIELDVRLTVDKKLVI